MAHPKALFPILKNERGKQTQGLLRNLDIEGSVFTSEYVFVSDSGD